MSGDIFLQHREQEAQQVTPIPDIEYSKEDVIADLKNKALKLKANIRTPNLTNDKVINDNRLNRWQQMKDELAAYEEKIRLLTAA